jgi:hypothetical protein
LLAQLPELLLNSFPLLFNLKGILAALNLYTRSRLNHHFAELSKNELMLSPESKSKYFLILTQIHDLHNITMSKPQAIFKEERKVLLEDLTTLTLFGSLALPQLLLEPLASSSLTPLLEILSQIELFLQCLSLTKCFKVAAPNLIEGFREAL